MDDLNNQKILYSEIVRKPQFYLDDGKFIPEASAFYLKAKNLEYIKDYLNSDFSAWIFRKYYAGGGLGESGFRYKKAFIVNLRVPKLNCQDFLKAFNFSNEEIDYINNQLKEFSK